eukprot:GHVO01014921.1.p1 GENE.GHVO01014921.1~~GHVO01014921.1.p1  ORF type:complete len:390 (+),score=25.72 GHVO01014921.1:106-1275(+)
MTKHFRFLPTPSGSKAQDVLVHIQRSLQDGTHISQHNVYPILHAPYTTVYPSLRMLRLWTAPMYLFEGDQSVRKRSDSHHFQRIFSRREEFGVEFVEPTSLSIHEKPDMAMALHLMAVDSKTGNPIMPMQLSLIVKPFNAPGGSYEYPNSGRHYVLQRQSIGRYSVVVPFVAEGNEYLFPIEGLYNMSILIAGPGVVRTKIDLPSINVTDLISNRLTLIPTRAANGTDVFVLPSELNWLPSPPISFSFSSTIPDINIPMCVLYIIILTTLPLTGLVWLWDRIGSNINKFPYPSKYGWYTFFIHMIYQALICVIALLLVAYWLRMRLMTLLRILLPLCIVTLMFMKMGLKLDRTRREEEREQNVISSAGFDTSLSGPPDPVAEKVNARGS